MPKDEPHSRLLPIFQGLMVPDFSSEFLAKPDPRLVNLLEGLMIDMDTEQTNIDHIKSTAEKFSGLSESTRQEFIKLANYCNNIIVNFAIDLPRRLNHLLKRRQAAGQDDLLPLYIKLLPSDKQLVDLLDQEIERWDGFMQTSGYRVPFLQYLLASLTQAIQFAKDPDSNLANLHDDKATNDAIHKIAQDMYEKHALLSSLKEAIENLKEEIEKLELSKLSKLPGLVEAQNHIYAMRRALNETNKTIHQRLESFKVKFAVFKAKVLTKILNNPTIAKLIERIDKLINKKPKTTSTLFDQSQQNKENHNENDVVKPIVVAGLHRFPKGPK